MRYGDRPLQSQKSILLTCFSCIGKVFGFNISASGAGYLRFREDLCLGGTVIDTLAILEETNVAARSVHCSRWDPSGRVNCWQSGESALFGPDRYGRRCGQAGAEGVLEPLYQEDNRITECHVPKS